MRGDGAPPVLTDLWSAHTCALYLLDVLSLSLKRLKVFGETLQRRTDPPFTISTRLAEAGRETVFSSIARWWSQTGSNRRPHACKARALPTELWPLWGSTTCGSPRWMVGPGRLELPTLRLSGVRSNQLSYGPMQRPRSMAAGPCGPCPLGSRSRRTP